MPICRKRVIVTTVGYNVSERDSIILADATLAGFSLNLPTAVGQRGWELTITKIDSHDENQVSILPDGSETIDGASSWNIFVQWQSITLTSDGENWVTTGALGTFDTKQYISELYVSSLLQVNAPVDLNGQVHIDCLELSVLEVTANHAVALGDTFIISKPASVDITLTLPVAASYLGKLLIIKHTPSDATYHTILAPNGGDLVEGLANMTLSVNGESVMMQAVTGGWKLVASLSRGGLVAVQFTDGASVGSGETDLFSLNIGNNLLPKNGDRLVVEGFGALADATIRMKVKVDSTTYADTGSLAPGAIAFFWLRLVITRVDASTHYVQTVYNFSNALSAAALDTVPVIVRNSGLGTLAGDKILKLTGQGGSNGDVSLAPVRAWKESA